MRRTGHLAGAVGGVRNWRPALHRRVPRVRSPNQLLTGAVLLFCRTWRPRCFFLILACVAGLPLAGAAQSPFSFVKWRSIGPVNTSGRIDDIAVARGDPARGEGDEIYVATASGGLWKSMNNGISWSPVFDGVDAMMSIGAVAVAPSARLTVT